MPQPLKVLFLAMDAGDKFLIQKWAGDGTLPNWRNLLARGLVGDTRSVEGLYEGSTWPSFYTGVTPARHGFHRLTQIRPGTYEFHRCYPGEFIRREPFWKQLSDAGRKVAILDIPLAGVSQGLNGIQMVEWGSHDGVYGFRTWPGELKREVIKRFGKHPLTESCDSFGRSPQEFRIFRDRLIEGVKKKAELTLHYWKKADWAFFAQVFTEGHCAGHQCWHLHDPAHPNYDRNTAALTGDPIREVYREIDGAIGRILGHIGENALVFLFATHRMSHNIGADFLLEKILENLNLLKKRSIPTSYTRPSLFKRVLVAARATIPRGLKANLKPALLPLFGSVKSWLDSEGPRQISSWIDLARSKCFPHENGNLVSGIRLNLVERDPAGIVRPGEEFRDLCKELREDLLEIVDRASGKPVITRVLETSDLFQGEYVHHLPDLLVEWNEEIMLGSKAVRDDPSCRLQLTSKKIGIVEGEYTYCRTGDHRPEGLLIVAGPGIRPGKIGRTISIMDFAPTFLALLGLHPSGLDGEPIGEILETCGRS